jgi:hypothetical protein
MRAPLHLLVVCVLTCVSTPLPAGGGGLQRHVPQDARLAAKTLDDYHPFRPPADLAGWRERARRVREQVLVAAGLWPMPPPFPLAP